MENEELLEKTEETIVEESESTNNEYSGNFHEKDSFIFIKYI